MPWVQQRWLPQVYRYDASANRLDCASCNPTGATDEGEGGPLETRPRPHQRRPGLLRIDPGPRSRATRTERSTSMSRGKYGKSSRLHGLISTGTSRFDSKLLGQRRRHRCLLLHPRHPGAPGRKRNPAKLYDARELGGFPYIPPPVPCKASDECHGPGSAAPPPDIGTVTGSRRQSRAAQANTTTAAASAATKHHKAPPTWLSHGGTSRREQGESADEQSRRSALPLRWPRPSP